MIKLAANLTMLFTEVPFLDRFGRAADAGFEAVEFLFPYEFAIEDIRSRLDEHRLTLALHNLPGGNWAGGERGIACLPGRTEEFRSGVAAAVRYASALGVKRINCLAGKTPADEPATTVHETLIANLRYAATELSKIDVMLLVEPINPFDIPGFHITTTAQAIAIIDEVGMQNVRLQYDVYHAQRVEGELAGTIRRYLPRIAHVQIADNPGRNEPGTGEINYSFLFRYLTEIGYDGYIGCEYKPAGTTEEGLGWMETFGFKGRNPSGPSTPRLALRSE